MRRLVLLLVLLAACAPPPPTEPPARPVPPAPALRDTEVSAALEADLREDEEAVGPAAEATAGDPPDADGHVASSSLPAYLRQVREPPPVTFIGSGQSWPKRVGLQVGHWGNEQLPAEQEQLKASGGGAVGGGYTEVQINYDLAVRTAALLRQHGVEVDVIPAKVPVDYRADAFVAIHADGDERGALRGYKIARSPLSQIPAWDDSLVQWLYAAYGRATGLPRDDDHITSRMLYYYAFNNRRYYHAIAPSTPAAIVETGFVTSAADRAVLVGTPDRAAAGLAAGLLGFLGLATEY